MSQMKNRIEITLQEGEDRMSCNQFKNLEANTM